MSNRRRQTNENEENGGNTLGNLPSFAPPLPPVMGRSGSSMMPPPPPAMGRSGSSMMLPPPSFGYGRYHNTRSEANIKADQARTKKATEELLARLPDPTQAISMVLSLHYFAILPNGTRIPIESLFDYASEHPKESLFRTLDDRLVTIIETIQPNGEVYWRQAMYCSTGISSGMRYTWFPFNGIFARREGYGQTKPIQVALWFEKEYFNPSEGDERGFKKMTRFNPPRTPDNAVVHVYSGLGLPEGDFTYYTESPEDQAEFDRFGSLSYFVASYKLGSKFFINMLDTKLYPSTYTGPFAFSSYHPDKGRYERMLDFLTEKQYKDIDVLRSLIETPNEIDYTVLVKSIPIANPNIINTMIDRFQAASIYNYFRNRPIRIPPYSAYSVFLPTLGYALPKAEVFSMFHKYINYTFLNSVENKLSDDQIQTRINKDFAYTLDFNEFETLKNNYNIVSIHPKNKNYFGGTRGKARAQTRRRVRAQSRRRGGHRRT